MAEDKTKQAKEAIDSVIKDMKATMKDQEEKHEDSTDKGETDTAFQLYKYIYDNTVAMLESEPVVKIFSKMAEDFGPDTASNLMAFIGLAMTQSAYAAVAYYDQVMSQVLDKAFSELAVHINTATADIEGIKAAMQVFRKRLDEVQNKIKIKEFAAENNIPVE